MFTTTVYCINLEFTKVIAKYYAVQQCSLVIHLILQVVNQDIKYNLLEIYLQSVFIV